MAVKPHTLTVRCYAVGFGDCFLLTFRYAGNTGDRHMLIDFGTTQKPPKADSTLMKRIAADIATVVGPRLHAIVATHRHTDHISGFATNAKKDAPGNIIAKLSPALVIQPWTEALDAPTTSIGKGLGAAANDALRVSLERMQTFAAATLKHIKHLPIELRQQIAFIGEDGLKNVSAVKNLAAMGKKGAAAYVYYGKKVPQLKTLFPGVQFDIIGPPTIRQKKDVKNQNPRNEDEYWNFTKFWRLSEATVRLSGAAVRFAGAPVLERARIPIESRWFVRKLSRAHGEQLLSIVRAMDDALNNTSVILLIRAGSKRLVFPGDAQWENWEYALQKKGAELANVDVYKVGHHGSLNATPKTLWKGFARKSAKKNAPDRLLSLMSTVSNSKHGHSDKGTEVPRETLVKALRAQSNLRTTQELETSGTFVLPPIDIDLR